MDYGSIALCGISRILCFAGARSLLFWRALWMFRVDACSFLSLGIGFGLLRFFVPD